MITLTVLALGCKMQPDDRSSAGTVSTPSSSSPVAAPAAGPASHVRVIHAPPDGDVAPLVHAELGRASAEGRQLVVYVGATWCEPCQRFHHAVERGELDATFPRLNLLEFDTDHDNERLATAGYVSQYIPLLALPSVDGTASGKQIEGGIKGGEVVGYLSSRLQQLLTPLP